MEKVHTPVSPLSLAWSIHSGCRSSHFFNTVLMLETLASLNLLLAMDEMLRSGFALG